MHFRFEMLRFLENRFRKLLVWLRQPKSLALVAIYVIGLAFRVWGLSSASLWEDEAHSALMTLGIIKFGIPVLPSGHIPTLEPPLFPYLMAVFWSLFGENMVLARAIGGIVSSLMILVVYKVGADIWNREAGIVASVFVALDPLGIVIGRQFRSYSFAGLSALLLAWIAIKIMKKELRGWKLLIVGFVVSLFALTSSYLLILAFASLFVGFMLIRVLKPVIDSTRLVSEDKDGALPVRITIDDAGKIVKPAIIIVFLLLLFTLALNYSDLILRAISEVSNEFFRSLPETEVSFHLDFLNYMIYIYGPLIVVGIFGLIVLLVFKPRYGLLLSTLFFLPFLIFSTVYVSYTVTPVFPRYIYPFMAFIHIFAGIAIVSFSRFLLLLGGRSKDVYKHVKLRRYRRTIYAFVIVVLFMSHTFVRLSEAGMLLRVFDPKVLSDIGQPDYLSAANIVKSQILPTDIIISTRPHVSYYLFGHTEYWLISAEQDIREIGRKVDGKIVDYMVGAELISDLHGFLQVIQEHRSGWILIPYYHLGQEAIHPAILTMIKNSFNNYTTPDGTVYIYHWDNA